MAPHAITGLSVAYLYVSDLDRSIAFYQGLGLDIARHPHNPMWAEATFENGVRFALEAAHDDRQPAPPGSVRIDFAVADFEAAIRRNGISTLHPVGTCRMGHGPNTVVDDRLKVHGIEGLRIADASIFPTLPSGNTNAPSILVGEKAADILRAA